MTGLAAGQPFLATALRGVRVLDVSRFLAGPYASWILAELGADVVKVEDPDRPDEARSVGPYFIGGQSLYFNSLNTGKRSLAVRLRTREGRDLLHRIVAECDVVLDNQRPGVMARLGLGRDDLTRVNPRIVTVSLSGYGESGPLSELPGYDYTIQAVAGVMSMTGEPGGPPGKAGISYVDHAGGLAAALAVCAGLVARGDGDGGHVELSLHDLQISMLTYLAAWQLNAGFEGDRTPSASHPTLVPAQNFQTADGYISLFVGNDAMWARLAAALDDPWFADERFAESHGRQRARDELVGRLAALFLTYPTGYWVELFTGSGVPCAPINTLAQALAEEHVHARDRIANAHHPKYGDYRYVRGPLPGALLDSPAPLLGEHTTAVMRDCGLGDAEIARMLAEGVVHETDHPAETEGRRS